MNRRIVLSVLAIGLLTALVGVNMFISAAAIPDNVGARGPLETVNAVKTSVFATLTALKANIGGSVTAIRGDLGGTITALSGTMAGFRATYGPTLTSIAPTIQALRTNISGTTTALGMTITVSRPQIIGTATAYAAAVQAIKSTEALTPSSGDVAGQTIITYAAETLAIPVTVVKAGGLDANIVKSFPVPASVSFAQTISGVLSRQTYVAQLSNGVAWLNFGVGPVTSSAGPAANAGAGSLGVFALKVPSSGTLDATSALALAKTTYPGLSGYTYTPTTAKTGFSWYSFDLAYTTTAVSGIVIPIPQTIILSVIPENDGTATVSVAVGRSVYSTNLIP